MGTLSCSTQGADLAERAGKPLVGDQGPCGQGPAGPGVATPPAGQLLITHDLKGLDRAAGIVVLDRGRVAERGSHATLIRSSGVYQRPWQAQRRAS